MEKSFKNDENEIENNNNNSTLTKLYDDYFSWKIPSIKK